MAVAGEVVRSLDGGAELQLDGLVARFDLAGQRLTGSLVLGAGGADSVAAVAVDRCGRAFVAGFTSGPAVGAHLGNRDGFLALVRGL